MTSMVEFTALRCGLDASQVDLDLYTSRLTPLRCITAQAAVTIQVITTHTSNVMTFLRSA
jgi:hypothetical protein